MRVVPGLVALFSHSVVRLVPMIANVLAALAQHHLHFVVRFFFSKKMANRLDNFTIDVELCLLARGIANPHRLRTPISGEMLQFTFAWRTFTRHIVSHAQLWPGEIGGVQKPVHERFGVALVTETK